MKIIQYQKIAPRIRTGDVILFKGADPFSWLIEKYSKGFCHACICLRLEEFSALKNRRWILEAGALGVYPKLLSKIIEEHKETWLFPLKRKFNFKRDELASWGLSHIGAGYDYWGLFKNLFGYISPDLRRFFCSEFVYYDFAECGIIPKQKKAPRPGDIALWDCFKPMIRLEA